VGRKRGKTNPCRPGKRTKAPKKHGRGGNRRTDKIGLAQGIKVGKENHKEPLKKKSGGSGKIRPAAKGTVNQGRKKKKKKGGGGNTSPAL